MSVVFFDSETISSIMKNYFHKELNHYSDIKYAYMIVNKKNLTQTVVISNYPGEWLEIYKEGNYQHIDPVVLTALNKVSPFLWLEKNILINSSLKLSEIFNLSKRYNIVNGYTFVLHDQNNNLAMLSILLNKFKTGDIEEVIENNKDKLQMLLITAHEKITSLYRDMTKNNSNKVSNDKEIFSQRENEILYWASVGKTYQEIALILGIKVSTVKFHIGNAVKKIGAINAKHAIRLGIELQLITPILSTSSG
ncbi:LuxR family transcriptional regulator [Pectobacteriaceae bacterium C52]|nr:LuxR family transcriptional regulator [Pectobacteriaceae bacterium C52]